MQLIRQSGCARLAGAACLAGLAAAMPAGAGEVLDGPVAARVERVVDGDTLAVRARIWIGQEIEVHVRVRGIDAPETRGGCATERDLARRATLWLQAAIGAGEVTLRNIEQAKYAGRVLATVTTAEGGDVAETLLAARLARPYEGAARVSWCPLAGG